MVQEITFMGVLLQVPLSTERCGDNAIAVVHKFHVLQILEGILTEDRILLIIACPELKGESFFTKDGKYKIKATSDLSKAEEYIVANQYKFEQAPLLFEEEIHLVI